MIQSSTPAFFVDTILAHMRDMYTRIARLRTTIMSMGASLPCLSGLMWLGAGPYPSATLLSKKTRKYSQETTTSAGGVSPPPRRNRFACSLNASTSAILQWQMEFAMHERRQWRSDHRYLYHSQMAWECPKDVAHRISLARHASCSCMHGKPSFPKSRRSPRASGCVQG